MELMCLDQDLKDSIERHGSCVVQVRSKVLKIGLHIHLFYGGKEIADAVVTEIRDGGRRIDLVTLVDGRRAAEHPEASGL